MSHPPAATTPDRAVAPSGVAAFNDLSPEAAHGALLRCCGAERWVAEMLDARPFASVQAALDRAGAAFGALAREDWLQAFAAHARIGAPRASDARGAAEQAGASSASAAELEALEDLGARYEARFGHVFLIRASGRDAGEMLAALRERLDHPPARELELAAAQQREITRLRLETLLAS